MGFNVLKLALSEYVLPVGFLDIENLKKLDKLLSLLHHVPLFKYLGGSTQIFMKKKILLELSSSYKKKSWLEK